MIQLRVPASAFAKIRGQSILGRLDVGDGLTKMEGAFCTLAALKSKTPMLTISVNVAMDSPQIKTI